MFRHEKTWSSFQPCRVSLIRFNDDGSRFFSRFCFTDSNVFRLLTRRGLSRGSSVALECCFSRNNKSVDWFVLTIYYHFFLFLNRNSARCRFFQNENEKSLRVPGRRWLRFISVLRFDWLPGENERKERLGNEDSCCSSFGEASESLAAGRASAALE